VLRAAIDSEAGEQADFHRVLFRLHRQHLPLAHGGSRVPHARAAQGRPTRASYGCVGGYGRLARRACRPIGVRSRMPTKRGYDLSAVRARQIALGDFEVFGWILCMDQSNLRDVKVCGRAHTADVSGCSWTLRPTRAARGARYPITAARRTSSACSI
jgi:hypothetical protein